jgi:ATP-dependent helicase YprA (DUF1998 family)
VRPNASCARKSWTRRAAARSTSCWCGDWIAGKFLKKGYPEGKPPVPFARYTGQEKGPERDAIRSNPPDILLTNYMMLELLLTRSEDRELVRAAQGLRFLVFDELHTYRGRQGADLALLIRRCRMPSADTT